MSLYAELGVAADASPEEIKCAHRRKAKEHHPDRGGDQSRFQQIQLAYDTLGDGERRRRYDQTGQTAGPEGPDPAVVGLAILMDGLIDQMLADGMPIEHEDMRKHALEAIDEKLRGIKNEKGRLERALNRARKLGRRWKRKAMAKGPDIIASTLARKEIAIADSIAKVAEALEVWGQARELLLNYDYRWTPAESSGGFRQSPATSQTWVQFDFGRG